jgi:5-methylcytosine-specific restriction endonuclease McrA
MLPQSRALEAADADNREGQDETVGGKGAIPKPVANIPEGRRFERSALRPQGQCNVRFDGGFVQVFVLDKKKKPLMPCHPARARELLREGRAVVHRIAPFTIRLKDRIGGETQPIRVKLDPGSKTTGLAVVREEETDGEKTAHVLFQAEIHHRGSAIKKKLDQRRAFRRRRRSQLRYRTPRFDNRTRPDGWLPPSLRHRVDTTLAWVERLRRLVPVSELSQELVRFDMQKIENPEISGVEYQQGTLAGYEVREYLLEKWGRTCAYCGSENVPLEIDHIHPRSLGGSDRVSNLTLACRSCNLKKGNRPVGEFLAKTPERLSTILARAKAPLKDAAAVNTTRWALFQALKATGLPVETASGGRTKWNRTRLLLPKTHALDAACVGKVDRIEGWNRPCLSIKSTGRGSYQRTRLDSFGFPRGFLTRTKAHFGFQTGDRVMAIVTKGKKTGTYAGRVAVRSSGSFNIQTGSGVVQGISYKDCRLLQRADGYGYSIHPITEKGGAGEAISLPGMNAGVSRARG